MSIYNITVKQLKDDIITLENIRDVFTKLGIRKLKDFHEIKKNLNLKIPSFCSLNALCKAKKGKNFEIFFFGVTELNFKFEQRLMDDVLIEEIKDWCFYNNVRTVHEYRFTKRPNYFPTYKKTIDNYGEDYFYDVIGLYKYKSDFSTKI